MTHRSSVRARRSGVARERSVAEAGPDEEPPAVRLDGVEHAYESSDRRLGSGRGQPVEALSNVEFEVEPGEVVGLAGPSGSGKTTALHAIAGLVVPTGGSVELLGADLTDCSASQRLRLRRRHVGIVFQRFHLLPALSARANVALPLVQAGWPRSRRRGRATALLEGVGLADRTGHRPGELSGGECQRVAIARALATDPAVVVADEPTGELDAATSETVLEYLTAAADDRAVVLASHDETALAAADRVLHLRDGSVVDRVR